MGKAGDVMIKDTSECLAKYREFKGLLENAVQSTDSFLTTVTDMEEIGNNMNKAKETLMDVRIPLAESLASIEAQDMVLKKMCERLDELQNVDTF